MGRESKSRAHDTIFVFFFMVNQKRRININRKLQIESTEYFCVAASQKKPTKETNWPFKHDSKGGEGKSGAHYTILNFSFQAFQERRINIKRDQQKRPIWTNKSMQIKRDL